MPIFKVFRYNPDSEDMARFQEYELPETESMTVLEGLYYIIENIDTVKEPLAYGIPYTDSKDLQVIIDSSQYIIII